MMAGDRRDRRVDHAADRGARLRPGLPAGRETIAPDDDHATLAARLQALGGDLLVRALDERPPWVEQDEAGVTYAHKIEAADRTLDHTRTPEELERVVRALRPHIGARLPLPDGSMLGVVAARVRRPDARARRAATCAPTASGCCSTAAAGPSS